MPSLFRKPVDQSMLTESQTLVDDVNRRGVLRGALSLGALAMLTGCDVSEDDSVQKALRTVSVWNDRVQEAIFRPNHLAPTFRPSQVVKPPRFNAYYDIEDVKPVDGATWNLELAGRIADKRNGPAQICAVFSNALAPISRPSTSILSAPTISPKASIWQPRCIRRPSLPPNTRATSSPIRSAIRCKAIEVTNDFRETFWSKQGFNWFAGI